jgi:hypothetical protein
MQRPTIQFAGTDGSASMRSGDQLRGCALKPACPQTLT